VGAVVLRTARGPVQVLDGGRPDGPVVLVVHGMPGDYRQGVTLLEDLGDVARVLLVSRPGYGKTPLSSGRSPQQQGDLWAALLDELGIEQALVVGVSGGGPSSYAFAAQHPTRCSGLVLLCAVAAHVFPVPVVMRRLAVVPGLWPLLATLARGRARIKPPVVGTDFTTAELLVIEECRPALERFTRDTPTWLSGTGLRNDVRQLHAATTALTGVTAPTLVLHGSADELVPMASAEAYAELVPGAVLEVLDGLGHAIPLFARSLVAQRVRAMLSSAPDRSTPGTASQPA